MALVVLVCLPGSKSEETSPIQKVELILDYQHLLRAGTGLGYFKMADKPTMKMRKKSKSFSYDRRRDSVKVKRQTKSATLETCKIQVKEKQVGTNLAQFLMIWQ